MICTSSYSDWHEFDNKLTTYSISGNRGIDANYQGKCYPKLAPKRSFWKIWHDNIGIIPEEENIRYYIQEFYNQVLSKLDPEEIYKELNNSVLLCYEPNTAFCHRHIVAAWLEILLDVKIYEVKIKDNKIEKVSRPRYIKKYLEEIMKLNKDMQGFTSLRALYLFEKAKKLEHKIEQLSKETPTSYDKYKQEISYLFYAANKAEEEYQKLKSQHINLNKEIEYNQTLIDIIDKLEGETKNTSSQILLQQEKCDHINVYTGFDESNQHKKNSYCQCLICNKSVPTSHYDEINASLYKAYKYGHGETPIYRKQRLNDLRNLALNLVNANPNITTETLVDEISMIIKEDIDIYDKPQEKQPKKLTK